MLLAGCKGIQPVRIHLHRSLTVLLQSGTIHLGDGCYCNCVHVSAVSGYWTVWILITTDCDKYTSLEVCVSLWHISDCLLMCCIYLQCEAKNQTPDTHSKSVAMFDVSPKLFIICERHCWCCWYSLLYQLSMSYCISEKSFSCQKFQMFQKIIQNTG